MKSVRNNLIIVLQTVLSLYAFSFEKIFDAGESVLYYYAYLDELVDFSWALIGVAVFIWYSHIQNKYKSEKIQKSEMACSVIFALFFIFGKSFSLYDNWNLVLGSRRQLFYALFAIIGLTVFFYSVLNFLSFKFRHGKIPCVKKDISEEQTKDNNSNKNLVSARVCGIMLIGWLPYIITTWPGSVPTDTMVQLRYWFGSYMSNHHPWFTSMIFGILMQAGQIISDNMGVFFIVIFQMILCLIAFSHVCMKVKKYGGSAYISAVFFALVPVWGCYVSAAAKDVVFVAIYCLYFSYFIEAFVAGMGKAKFQLKDWIIFAGLNLLICVIRNDGIYRIIPSSLILFIAIKQYKKQIILMLIACCTLFSVYNYVSFDILGIDKGSIREMLSIPFQQTARYVRDYGDEVTDKEKETIDKVLPYDSLAEAYNPELSDPVKNMMLNCTTEELIQYFKVWVKMGLKHPSVYIQATMNNTYSYFYPFHNSQASGGYVNFISESYNPGFNIYYVNPEMKELILEWANLWRVFPALSLLTNPGFYTWLLLFGIMILVKLRKFRELSVASVLILHLAVCVASPVNGSLRYTLPLIACMPLFLVWVKWVTNEKKALQIDNSKI